MDYSKMSDQELDAELARQQKAAASRAPDPNRYAGMSDAELDAELARQAPETRVGHVEDALRSLPGSLAEAGAGVLGIPRALAEAEAGASEWGADQLRGLMGREPLTQRQRDQRHAAAMSGPPHALGLINPSGPSTEGMLSEIKKRTGEFHEPQHFTGRATRVAGHNVPGLVGGPLSYGLSVAGGVGLSEAARLLGHPEWMGAGEALGSLFGGAAGSKPITAAGKATARVGKALRGASAPEMKAKAILSEVTRDIKKAPAPPIPRTALPPLRTPATPATPSIPQTTLPPLRTPERPPVAPQMSLPPLRAGPEPQLSTLRYSKAPPEVPPAPTSSSLRYSEPPPAAAPEPTSSPLAYSRALPEAVEPSRPLTMAGAAPAGPEGDRLRILEQALMDNPTGAAQRDALLARRKAIAEADTQVARDFAEAQPMPREKLPPGALSVADVGVDDILSLGLKLPFKAIVRETKRSQAKTARSVADIIAGKPPEEWDITKLQRAYTAQQNAQWRAMIAQALQGDRAQQP